MQHIWTYIIIIVMIFNCDCYMQHVIICSNIFNKCLETIQNLQNLLVSGSKSSLKLCTRFSCSVFLEIPPKQFKTIQNRVKIEVSALAKAWAAPAMQCTTVNARLWLWLQFNFFSFFSLWRLSLFACLPLWDLCLCILSLERHFRKTSQISMNC